ncbi:MAG: RDD family protein [Reichenbachiella sp.]|uniref:RDD family protein n=1 Tax=Reichenbachiella sp. TaxID=2184521 RepID=UPI003263C9B3
MKKYPKIKYATFAQRLLAFNLDMTLFLFTVVPLLIFIEDDVLFVVLFLAVICLYHAGFESSPWQATFGKKYAGLVVVDLEGSRISFGRALLRIITKNLSLLLFFSGFLMIYIRRDRKGLHDLLVKTFVIDVKNSLS